MIEALGFAPAWLRPGPANEVRRRQARWLAGPLPAGVGTKTRSGRGPDGPWLAWIGSASVHSGRVRPPRRGGALRPAPLAALTARATLTAALEAYLGRRSAARVLAGPLRRGVGETIQAALLFADLRGFTALSEAHPSSAVIASLDAWFDRIAGAVHAFGGEVLKFIGDGVLAIFPVDGGSPGAACDAALSAVAAARAGMAHLDEGAPAAGRAAPALRRRAASRRIPVGQYRRGRPARLHRDRSRRQSGLPPGRPLPPARQGRPRLGRLRRGNRNATDPARRPCPARHRIALRRLHCAEVLSPGGRNSAIGPAETTNRLCFPIFVDCSTSLALCNLCTCQKGTDLEASLYSLL